MKLIEQESWIRIRLNLSEGWERTNDANEAQRKLLAWDKGPFWWYDETKEYIITLKNWKFVPYKLSNTVVILPTTADKKISAIRKTVNDLNFILKLNYKNRVKNWAEAQARAEAWEKEIFWLITEDKKTIATLDYTKWDKPIIADYPRDKTNVRYQRVAI